VGRIIDKDGWLLVIAIATLANARTHNGNQGASEIEVTPAKTKIVFQ
jgi:hypothetical protein